MWQEMDNAGGGGGDASSVHEARCRDVSDKKASGRELCGSTSNGREDV